MHPDLELWPPGIREYYKSPDKIEVKLTRKFNQYTTVQPKVLSSNSTYFYEIFFFLRNIYIFVFYISIKSTFLFIHLDNSFFSIITSFSLFSTTKGHKFE